MPNKREDVLLSAFVALESAHFYSAFLPSVMTIRKFNKDAEALQALRQGEIIASGMSFALAWIVSELIDSHLPLIFSLVTIAVMLTMYEFAIQGSFAPHAMKRAGLIGAAVVIPGVPPF